MAFNDLLSTSFLFSVAIIIILIGGIFAYVSYRMSEQDHKITSMLGLVSTMAEELQFFRNKLSSLNQTAGLAREQSCDKSCDKSEENTLQQRHIIPILDPNNLVMGIVEPVSLISVSDESDNDDGDDDDDDDESNDDDDDDESDDDEEEPATQEYNLDEIVDLEPVSLIQNIDEDDINDVTDVNDIDDIDDINNTDNIKSIHLENPIDLNITNQEDDLFASDLKTISITDLEDTNKKPEYKKLSLNKLREVVLERGIVSDASKLKKNDLLKLLGDE